MDFARIMRWLTFVIWVCLTFWLTAHHELWRDEADSWLLARDASWQKMFSILPNKGQPPLWYILLKAANAVGFGWRTMQGINLLAVCIAGWLLVFRSYFTILLVLPLLFSFHLSYEYPVIARNYGLGIFGLYLYAYCQNLDTRFAKSMRVLAQLLMCGSTVHFLALSLVLFAFRILEKLRTRTWDLIAFAKQEVAFIAPFVFSILVLWPTGKGQFSSSLFDKFQSQNLRDSLANSLLPFDSPSAATMGLSLVCYWIALSGSAKPWRAGAMFLAGAGVLEAIFCFKYYSEAPRHSGLLFIWLITVLWINGLPVKSDRPYFSLLSRRSLAPLVMWLISAWNLPIVVNVWQLEATRNFSDAHEAAEILNSESMKNRPVVCWVPRNCTAILPYLSADRKFWYPEINREGTFEYWDAQSNTVHSPKRSITIDQVIASTIPKFSNWGKQDGPLFVSNWRVPDPDKYGLKLISPAKKSAWRILDESFWIYGPRELAAP